MRTTAALAAAAGLACAAAPASTPTRTIPAGVTVAGIHVGGLTAEPARRRIETSFLRPLRIATPRGIANVDPGRAGAVVDVDAAVSSALTATPQSSIAVPLRYSPKLAAQIVDGLARRFDRTPVNATVVGADASGPPFSAAKAGVAVDKQRDRWWYPPTYDEWAKGLKPVPPGPGNPLGTRWLGLDAPGVGIHGTDAPSSIGYSASHGCIRMQAPEAEWLFDHVRVGTPVVIL